MDRPRIAGASAVAASLALAASALVSPGVRGAVGRAMDAPFEPLAAALTPAGAIVAVLVAAGVASAAFSAWLTAPARRARTPGRVVATASIVGCSVAVSAPLLAYLVYRVAFSYFGWVPLSLTVGPLEPISLFERAGPLRTWHVLFLAVTAAASWALASTPAFERRG